MLISSTLHNHCTMCDGRNTLNEMIDAAAGVGFTDFGMSCHGYAPFDMQYSMPDEKTYLDTMKKAKAQYDGKIRLYTGVEEDVFAPSACPEKYDYIIGDVHYDMDRHTGEHIAVDGDIKDFIKVRDNICGGDAMTLVKRFFDNMVKAAEKRPTMIGHFDLVTKCNNDNRYFDEQSTEYMDTALTALEECNKYGVIFEVNTGAIARGYKALPYPAPFILKRLCELGGKVTVSADCHFKEYITCGFDIALKVIRDAGFKKISVWENGRFIEKEI